MRVGLYPGSFDPVTFGHVDIVRRAAHLVDRLVIAVGTHHDKHPLFTAEERVKLTEEVLAPVAKEAGLKLEVTTYDNLTVEAAKRAGASVVIRGLRDAGDFDYEMQMAGMNQALAPEIETVFLASSPNSRHIAASSRPPDCRNGRRRFVLRAEARRRGTQQEIRRLARSRHWSKEEICDFRQASCSPQLSVSVFSPRKVPPKPAACRIPPA